MHCTVHVSPFSLQGGMQSPTQYGPAQGGMFPAQQQPKQQKRLDPAHMPSQVRS